MAGTVLENLSGRKLFVLTSILVICQIVCFLIGGLIAPAPSVATTMIATKCLDPEANRTKWVYPRGKGGCRIIEQLAEDNTLTDGNIVFALQIPFPKDSVILDYTRWQQNMIGILQLEIIYSKESPVLPDAQLMIDARLAYRNDNEKEWKLYAESMEVRTLDCEFEDPKEGHNYNCGLIPLFELGSLHHDFYLINIRLPSSKDQSYNKGIGMLEDIQLVTIHQNGGFTKVWFSLKTIFTPLVLFVLVWYWQRVKAQGRPPALLEKLIFFLGVAIEFLNLPIEWLTLFIDMPYMLLIGDIRQGIFYAALLSFWLVFTGEHLMESGGEKNTLRTYWKHLSAVAVGCVALFLFDLCERGAHVANPFYSLWATPLGTRLALGLIIAAGISASLYFIFLSWMVWRVFQNISAKRTALPAMSAVRRMHYQGIIYRFKFLMLTTLACAAMTVIGFILGQVTEDKWKWDMEVHIEYTSAFYTGVYGMWNIYAMALLSLYAPSHKRWPPERDPYANTNSGTEEIEFTRLEPDTSEISALASFAKKVAAD
ncbi:Protein wntless [Orchesella cincta]|uniref:Protein wntless n=1 Tax=Orchesella cincta TaxID=48709 RepID=A0A1D2NJY5_ORCCI|nr:Protein wntless [Orchesella cincta]